MTFGSYGLSQSLDVSSSGGPSTSGSTGSPSTPVRRVPVVRRRALHPLTDRLLLLSQLRRFPRVSTLYLDSTRAAGVELAAARLDPSAVGPGQETSNQPAVTSIPEHGTPLLFGAGAGGAVVRKLRRRT